MAPDAVVRFAERCGEAHAAIRQRESFALPQMAFRQFPRIDAVHVSQLERNELQVIELARGAKQNAALVRRSPLLRVRRPRCIARRDIQRDRARRLVLLPSGHGPGKTKFGERLAQQRFDFVPQGWAVEGHGNVRLVGVHRLALHEKTLHRVQRCKLVMRRFESTYVGLDAEQAREKVLEVRTDRDQQLGFVLARQSLRIRAGRDEARRNSSVRLAKVRDEKSVDAPRALRRIQIGECETRKKNERRRRFGRHNRKARKGAELHWRWRPLGRAMRPIWGQNIEFYRSARLPVRIMSSMLVLEEGTRGAKPRRVYRDATIPKSVVKPQRPKPPAGRDNTGDNTALDLRSETP